MCGTISFDDFVFWCFGVEQQQFTDFKESGSDMFASVVIWAVAVEVGVEFVIDRNRYFVIVVISDIEFKVEYGILDSATLEECGHLVSEESAASSGASGVEDISPIFVDEKFSD